MILSQSPQPSPDPGTSDSFNCIDVILDGPADTTIRPCRPSMLAKIKAARDKVARWASSVRLPMETNMIIDLADDGSEPQE